MECLHETLFYRYMDRSSGLGNYSKLEYPYIFFGDWVDLQTFICQTI